MIARMEAVRAAVNAALEAALADLPDGDLTDAMRYACVGGKRIRAFLVLESARLHGVADAHAMPVAVAVEMLHAYSLVHDDLPAMDDDDLRRGMPTVHIQWSEATAILAGDALQARAFEMLADPAIGDCEIRVALPAELDRDQRIGLVRDFCQRSFVDRGMVADIALHAPGGRPATSPPRRRSSRWTSPRSRRCSRPRPGR